MIYFFIGASLTLSAIAGSYSLAIGTLVAGVVYYLIRGARWTNNEGTLFPNISGTVYDQNNFEVLAESEDELVIRGSAQALVVNRSNKTISNLKKVVCSIDQVQCVRIHYSGPNRDGYKSSYSVSLSLGGFSSISLGESIDASSASIAAAKLSAWTGRDVVTNIR